MTELRINDPCLIFALGRESQPFRRTFPPNQGFPGAPCWARFCGPAWLSVLVVETGVGPEKTQNFLDWLASAPALEGVAYRPKIIVNSGFCGALASHLQVGDVVLASEIVDNAGQCWAATWPGPLPPGPWHPPLHTGRLLTFHRLVADPDDKQRLAEKHGAMAVDMEAAIVARWCRQRGVPFGCVRAVSDDARTALSPHLAGLLAAGRVSAWRLLGALARRPPLLGELWRLARHTRRAGKQLGLALGELLTLTLPWFDPG